MKTRIILYVAFFWLSTQYVVQGQEIKEEGKNWKLIEQLKSGSRTGTINLPKGNIEKGRIRLHYRQNDLLSKDFKKKYPQIKSFDLYEADRHVGTLTYSDQLIIYFVHHHGETLHVEYTKGDKDFKRIKKKEYTLDREKCELNHKDHPKFTLSEQKRLLKTEGVPWPKRLYRLAVAVTGEYYQLSGSNDEEVLVRLVADINAIQAIFKRELSISFELLPPLLFDSARTDPFTEDQCGGDVRTDQAGRVIHANFSPEDYDFGHVIHLTEPDDCWSSGGLAQVASICSDRVDDSAGIGKANGWSSAFESNPRWSLHSVAAHEIGHMFGARHTFNGSGGPCQDAISEETAYEIGSGSSIMSYAGICDEDQNIPGAEENLYFHVASLIQMTEFVNTIACGEILDTDNTTPTVDANPCNLMDIRIPIGTPFFIEGKAVDVDNDQLQYNWEQYNEDGPESTETQGNIGRQAALNEIGPNFRSYPPTLVPRRYFPALPTLVNGKNSSDVEVLSLVPKEMIFKFLSRDINKEGFGSYTEEDIQIPIVDLGPLDIREASIPDVIRPGEPITLEWELNGTESLCTTASILLSTDGGISFPYTLSNSIVYAEGMATIVIPENIPSTESARIMLSCSDYDCIGFFDIGEKHSSTESGCGLGNIILSCVEDAYSFENNDPGLNLNKANIINGDKITEYLLRIDESLPTGLTYLYDVGRSSCFQEEEVDNIVLLDIEVSQSGNYIFENTFGSEFGRTTLTIFESEGFTENPCSSFITSTSEVTENGGRRYVSRLNSDLEECILYKVMIFNIRESNLLVGIESISGPGDVIVKNTALVNPNQMFVAVDKLSGQICYATQDGNFQDIKSGNFWIYGVELSSVIAAQDLFGKTLDQLFQEGICLVLSNKVSLFVESTCSIKLTIPEIGQCNPENSLFDQTLLLDLQDPPSTGNLLINDQVFPVSELSDEVVLEDLTADGSVVDIEASFSDLNTCFITIDSAFQAPENCCPFDINFEENVYSLCQGENLELALPAQLTYQWTKNDEFFSTENTVDIEESGNYAVVAQNDSGCAQQYDFEVQVFEIPSGSLTGPSVICAGSLDTLFLEDLSSDSVAFTWYRNNQELQNNNSVLAINSGGLYAVELKNQFGCSSLSQISVVENPTPQINLDEQIRACENEIVTINLEINPLIDVLVFKDMATFPSNNGELEITESGIYRIQLSNDFNCTTNKEVDVQFIASPTVEMGGDIFVCDGEIPTINVNTNADNFSWEKDGIPIAENSLSFVPEDGLYTLYAENEAGCLTIENIKVETLGVPEFELDNSLVGCLGSIVNLVGPTGDFTYLWRSSNGVIDTTSTIEVSTADVYALTVTNRANCSTTKEVAVQFVEGPTIDLGSDIAQCASELIILQLETNGNNISWFYNDSLVAEGGESLQALEAGRYTVRATGANSCIAEDNILVTIYESPVVDLGQDSSICEGQSLELNYNFDHPELLWYKDGEPINSGVNSIVIDQTGIYALEVISERGCPSIDSTIIIVNENPKINIESEYNYCEGVSLRIPFTTTATEIEWFLEDEAIGNSISEVFVNGAGELRAVALNDEGCRTEMSSLITSRRTPMFSLQGDTTICPGETISWTIAEAQSNDIVTWADGSNQNSFEMEGLGILGRDSIENIWATVTTPFSCSYSDTIQVRHIADVSAAIESNNTSICEGDSLILTATGGQFFYWQTNDQNIEIDSNVLFSIPTDAHSYQVTVSNSCSDVVDSSTIMIEVIPFNESIRASADTCITKGTSGRISGQGGLVYQWTPISSILSNPANAVIEVMPEEDTDFIVSILDENNCMYTDTVRVCVTENSFGIGITNYLTPNNDGSNDILEFEGLERISSNSLIIFDRWGDVVFSKDGYQSDDQRFTGMKGGRELPEGTYFYMLRLPETIIKESLTIIRD